MAIAKRKLSVSLDDDLVVAMEEGDEPVSVQVNEAVRNEIERRRHERALERFCDAHITETGPWTEQDEVEIARIMHLLGGQQG